MKNWKTFWIIIAILLVVVGVLAFSLFKTKTAVIVDSFETCAAAGNPIMESWPAQCVASDGRVFVQDITKVKPLPPNDGGDEVACTLEALECPDGTYVGRVGPNCEFAPCPGEN